MQVCNKIILCACGCGTTFLERDNWGRKRKYIVGHGCKGRIFTEEHRKKLSLTQYNENHNGWKGDKVGRDALHQWIKRHFWKPRLCQMCMKVPPYDLANKTGVYNRDFRNWRYYCRKCHMISDGRLANLRRIKRNPDLQKSL